MRLLRHGTVLQTRVHVLLQGPVLLVVVQVDPDLDPFSEVVGVLADQEADVVGVESPEAVHDGDIVDARAGQTQQEVVDFFR